MRETVKITLGGAEHRMRPSFEAFAEIEDRLDTTLPQLYRAHMQGALQCAEMGVIVAAGMNADTAGSAKAEDVARRLFEIGVMADGVRLPIAQYLLALAWTPEDGKKKLALEWGVPLSDGDRVPSPAAPIL